MPIYNDKENVFLRKVQSVRTKCGETGGLYNHESRETSDISIYVTSYIRVHLEKLIVAEMRKILPSGCGTSLFITVFTESVTKL